MGVSLFLSSVTAEFGPLRERLRGALTAPDVHIKIQEDFRPYADDTLAMLEDYVARCDGVVHFIGEQTGWTPPRVCVERLLHRRPEIAPELAEFGLSRADLDALSCTQWEAWFAILFRRRLLLVSPGPVSAPEQKRHLDRLKARGRYPLTFRNEDHLVAILLRSSINDALIEAGHATTPRQPNNLPYPSLGDLFKGRDAFLDDLRAALLSGGRSAVAGKAVHGLGGVGKTRVAVEYALRYGPEYSALLFVGAETPERLDSNLAGLVSAAVLDLPEQDVREDARKIAAAFGWLSRHPTWLVIFDNIDDETAFAALWKYWSQLTGGHVIVTGRLAHYPSGVRKLELGVLDDDSATAFLLERTEDDRIKRPDDPAQARALARELDGLALGLEQAGAYIAAERIGFARYGDLWRETRDKMLAWFDAYAMNSSRALATTWATSVARLSPESRRLLDRLAYLAPDPIPDFLLDVKAEGDDLDARAAMRDLWRYSLVSRAVYEDGKVTHDGFAVHRLLQDYARRAMDEERRGAALREALEWMNVGFKGNPQDVRTWPRLDPLAPHVLAAAEFGDAAGVADLAGYLLDRVATLAQTKGRFSEAEPLFRQSVALAERDEANSGLGSYINNLAMLLHLTNRAAEAEPLFRRALKIHEASYGPDHPHVAIRLNNLADLLRATNRADEAELLFRRALKIDEASYGPDHHHVARDLNNLGVLLRATNRAAEAEPLFRRALKIHEASYGPDHPEVATGLNNLASLLYDTNRADEAEPLFRRALKIDEASYGPEHPEVATDLNNLSLLLQETNRADEAEPLFRRAVAIFEASYGPDHPNTQIARENLRRLSGEEG